MNALHLHDRLAEAIAHLELAHVLAEGRQDALGTSMGALIEGAHTLLEQALQLATRPAIEASLGRLDEIGTEQWLREAAVMAASADAAPF